jgi:endoglycosylceramidase
VAPLARAVLFASASSAACALGCNSSGTVVPTGRACTIAPLAPPDWRLHTDGTQLKDGLGRVVFLRGVNAGGRSKLAPFVPFDYTDDYATALAAYMDRAASWGIDALRVPFTWEALEPVQGQDDADWLSRYQALLDAAWARGMWTVVDFHQDIYAQAFCGDGFPEWTLPPPAPAPHHDCMNWQLEYLNDPGVQAAFDRFWAAGSTVQAEYVAAWDVMIGRFKDEPGVVGFEPINEPGWGTADEPTFDATTLTDFYTRMATHMRSAAPDALVFVDGTGQDGVLVTSGLQRPASDGVVFAPHFYPILDPEPDNIVAAMKKWADLGAAWNAPVFVGEFGTGDQSPTAFDFMTNDFAALDALGLGGTEWEYSVASEEWNFESNSVVATDGTEYPVARALVRPYPRAVAGDGVVESWDAGALTFTLSYAPSASNVTEVAFPARAYPSGYRVALTGACYDAGSEPGRMLLQADPGATEVSLTVSSE